jgi:hypothetical protein
MAHDPMLSVEVAPIVSEIDPPEIGDRPVYLRRNSS